MGWEVQQHFGAGIGWRGISAWVSTKDEADGMLKAARPHIAGEIDLRVYEVLS